MKLGLASAAALGAWIGLSMPISAGRSSPQSEGTVRFSLCRTGGGVNCVVDGDTAWIDGAKVRIADIDAPETHPPRCAKEAERGKQATLRMQALMNAGPFEQRSIERDTDRYGRKLRVLVRDGRSLGDQLVAEGLARPYAGGRRPWC
jgi:endonuclease YncB( thermonuclease family)